MLNQISSVFLERPPKESLQYLLSRYSNYTDIDVKKIYNIILRILKYDDNKVSKEVKELEDRWYRSLINDEYDYSVYDSEYYICDMLVCWIKYSRAYLRSIISEKALPESGGVLNSLGDIKIIVDLGCGFGNTTLVFKELFPNAEVIGTNIKNTIQYKYAEDLGMEKGFNMVGDVKEINGDVDLLFASEYFEHFPKPIEHLKSVIDKLQPKGIIVANSFTVRAIGHFNMYYNNGEVLDNKNVARAFSKELEKNYEKVKIKVWNNRPNYWKIK